MGWPINWGTSRKGWVVHTKEMPELRWMGRRTCSDVGLLQSLYKVRRMLCSLDICLVLGEISPCLMSAPQPNSNFHLTFNFFYRNPTFINFFNGREMRATTEGTRCSLKTKYTMRREKINKTKIHGHSIPIRINSMKRPIA